MLRQSVPYITEKIPTLKGVIHLPLGTWKEGKRKKKKEEEKPRRMCAMPERDDERLLALLYEMKNTVNPVRNKIEKKLTMKK